MRLIAVQQKIVDELIGQMQFNAGMRSYSVRIYMPRKAGKESIRKALKAYFAKK